MKKKIFWLTAGAFFDTDKNIVPFLCEDYDIYWYILRFNNSFFSKDYLYDFLKRAGIKGEVVECPRIRTFSAAKIHFNIVKKYNKGNYDIGYFDYLGLPYLIPFMRFLRTPNKKTIFACHDYLEHIGSPNYKKTVLYKKGLFNHFPHIHFLSRIQLSLYSNDYKNGNPHFASMTLKNFGEPKANYSRSSKIRFLFFGRIEDRKGLEYVIEAGNLLYKQYSDKFIIKIAGGCKDWEKYQSLITEPKAFELDIRRIENDEIPDLLSQADFLLLPYKEVTQSGPLFISYNYNLPIIASNHPGFREFILDGETGLLFKDKSSESLANTMAEIIKGNHDIEKMRKRLKDYIDTNLSIQVVKSQYRRMFDSI